MSFFGGFLCCFFSALLLLGLIAIFHDWFGWFNGMFPGVPDSIPDDYKKELKRQFMSSEEYHRNNNINEICTIVSRIEISQMDNVNYHKEVVTLHKEILNKLDLYIYGKNQEYK